MIRKSPLCWALGLNIFFLFLYLMFGQVSHGSLDDYFMSSVLTGAYGSEYDVHLYFINAAYGYLLKPLYLLFPKVGWYFLTELAGTFAAFTSVSYFIIQKLGQRFGGTLTFFLLAALTPDFYFQLSFTQCATVYTAASFLLLYFGGVEKKKIWLGLGVLFFVAGSIMRHEALLMGLPFLCLLLSLQFLNLKKPCWPTLFALCVAIFAVWGLRTYDRSLYTEGDYRYYAEYQPIRAYFGDGAFYDDESTYDELEERQMNGLDYKLAKSWFFYDTRVLCPDSLGAMREISQRNLFIHNYKRFPIAFFMAISRAMTRTNGWCWVVFCLLLMVTPSWKSNIYPWVSLSIIALLFGYLLWINRLAYHVETGVWIYAVVSAIPLLTKESFTSTTLLRQRKKMWPVAVVVLSLVLVSLNISCQRLLKQHLTLIDTPEMPQEWHQFVAYAKERPNDAFLLSYDRYKELGVVKNPAYKAIAPGSWQNIFSWGYWNINLPGMKKELAKRGVQNPLRDIVNDNVYVLQDSYPSSLTLYYFNHYHKELQVDTVKAFGDLHLLKYSVKEANHE